MRAEDVADATEELREVIREAHEVTGDLARLVKEARALVDSVEAEVAKDVPALITAAVAVGLEGYREAIASATEDATNAVFVRFDTIMEVLTGETKRQKRIGPSLAEDLERAQAAGLARTDVGISHLRTSIRDGVTP